MPDGRDDRHDPIQHPRDQDGGTVRHAPDREHGWRGSMAAALHTRAIRAGSGIPAGVQDENEIRLFVRAMTIRGTAPPRARS
ncbi:MAG: hypothetical protein WHS83_02010 [Chloroflexus sp.]|uniref:hypothetical protein n=1 Tax=Chloroflexus sp. TaxID=1904827 RepID=UPI00309F951C